MIPKPIHLSHSFLTATVQAGETVVDATLGNGHDALFLARLVGPMGRVIGFDVQAQALQSSSERLSEAGLLDVCDFFHEGHECLAGKGLTDVAAVVFNLGYLPGADKSCTTREESSLHALAAAGECLRVGGMISIMCYVGHPGGAEEGSAVTEWAEALPRSAWRVFRYAMMNGPNDPPFLIVVEKTA